MQKMSAVCATNYYICIHDGLYDDLCYKLGSTMIFATNYYKLQILGVLVVI